MRFAYFTLTDIHTLHAQQMTDSAASVHQVTEIFLTSAQMEDPNLLEESSALMEGSEGGRGAPLRLG